MTFRTGDAGRSRARGASSSPRPTAAIVSPDLILMPLVAIDAAGNRVGMGKGHYDRALPGLRDAGARLIGCRLGRSSGSTTRSPPTRGTCPLDGFASPDGLEMFR